MVKAEDALDTILKSSHSLSRKRKFKEFKPPRIPFKLSAQAKLKIQKPCQIYFTKSPDRPEHTLTAIWKWEAVASSPLPVRLKSTPLAVITISLKPKA
jgi:hypothetical protein